MTKYEITFGARTIIFGVERSSRRTQVAISVGFNDGVVVKAPSDLDVESIKQVVRGKASWVVQRLTGFQELGPAPEPHEFVSGETFSYLGRQYRLRIHREADLRGSLVKLKGAWLEATIPEKGDPTQLVQQALKTWYRRLGSQRLPERVRIYAGKLGLEVPPVLVRDQQKRWGSCSSKGVLRFNWRIIMAPISLVDYVVAHEVCHLVVADHSPSFWKLLGTILPNHADLKFRLRAEGIHYRL